MKNNTTSNKNGTHNHSTRTTTPTHVLISKKLLDMCESLWGEPMTNQFLSDRISNLTVLEIDSLKEKTWKTQEVNSLISQIGIDKNDLTDKVDRPLRKNLTTETFFKTYLQKGKESSFSKNVENFIIFLCYIKIRPITGQPVQAKQLLGSPVLTVHSNKNWMRGEYSSIFKQLPARIGFCAELFGGSGILTADASNFGLVCIYNDDDRDKQNFFKHLISEPTNLELTCIYYLENSKAQITSKSPSLDKAAFFWVESYRKNKKKDLSQKQMEKAYELTSQFRQASEIYKNVKFIKRNALTYAKKFVNAENYLVIIDPPYLFTKDYSSRNTSNPKSFGSDEWDKLAEIFHNAKCIFIIHCRLTAKKDYSKKREEQNLEADTHIREEIEKLFADKGLYYKEIPYGGLGTIECMISNYQFKSFSPFTKENRYENLSEPNAETIKEEAPSVVTSDVNTNSSSSLAKASTKTKNFITTLHKHLKKHLQILKKKFTN